jgi:hypothetical protein
MRCLIYLRTSTKEQNQELQRKDCIEFCFKIGLEVAEVLNEENEKLLYKTKKELERKFKIKIQTPEEFIKESEKRRKEDCQLFFKE